MVYTQERFLFLVNMARNSAIDWCKNIYTCIVKSLYYYKIDFATLKVFYKPRESQFKMKYCFRPIREHLKLFKNEAR